VASDAWLWPLYSLHLLRPPLQGDTEGGRALCPGVGLGGPARGRPAPMESTPAGEETETRTAKGGTH